MPALLRLGLAEPRSRGMRGHVPFFIAARRRGTGSPQAIAGRVLQDLERRTTHGVRGYHVTVWHAADEPGQGGHGDQRRDGGVARPPAEVLAAIGRRCSVQVHCDLLTSWDNWS